jgi:hypothetical protein
MSMMEIDVETGNTKRETERVINHMSNDLHHSHIHDQENVEMNGYESPSTSGAAGQSQFDSTNVVTEQWNPFGATEPPPVEHTVPEAPIFTGGMNPVPVTNEPFRLGAAGMWEINPNYITTEQWGAVTTGNTNPAPVQHEPFTFGNTNPAPVQQEPFRFGMTTNSWQFNPNYLTTEQWKAVSTGFPATNIHNIYQDDMDNLMSHILLGQQLYREPNVQKSFQQLYGEAEMQDPSLQSINTAPDATIPDLHTIPAVHTDLHTIPAVHTDDNYTPPKLSAETIEEIYLRWEHFVTACGADLADEPLPLNYTNNAVLVDTARLAEFMVDETMDQYATGEKGVGDVEGQPLLALPPPAHPHYPYWAGVAHKSDWMVEAVYCKLFGILPFEKKE